jgi:hypothetical protein
MSCNDFPDLLNFSQTVVRFERFTGLRPFPFQHTTPTHRFRELVATIFLDLHLFREVAAASLTAELATLSNAKNRTPERTAP